MSNLHTHIGYLQPQSLKVDDAISLMNQANVELRSKLHNLQSCLQIPVFCPKHSRDARKCLGKETSASKTTRAALLKADSLLPWVQDNTHPYDLGDCFHIGFQS